MAGERSTAGVVMKYAVESTIGAKPATFSTTLGNIKGIPALDMAPSSLDSTTFEDTVYKRYTPGLIDIGGDIAIDMNLTQAIETAWTAMVTADQALTDGKCTWFEITVPGMTKKFYFSGHPAALGVGAMSVDSILEVQGHIVPVKVSGWLS